MPTICLAAHTEKIMLNKKKKMMLLRRRLDSNSSKNTDLKLTLQFPQWMRHPLLQPYFEGVAVAPIAARVLEPPGQQSQWSRATLGLPYLSRASLRTTIAIHSQAHLLATLGAAAIAARGQWVKRDAHWRRLVLLRSLLSYWMANQWVRWTWEEQHPANRSQQANLLAVCLTWSDFALMPKEMLQLGPIVAAKMWSSSFVFLAVETSPHSHSIAAEAHSGEPWHQHTEATAPLLAEYSLATKATTAVRAAVDCWNSEPQSEP